MSFKTAFLVILLAAVVMVFALPAAELEDDAEERFLPWNWAYTAPRPLFQLPVPATAAPANTTGAQIQWVPIGSLLGSGLFGGGLFG